MVKLIARLTATSFCFLFLAAASAPLAQAQELNMHQSAGDIVKGCEALSAPDFPRELGIDSDFTRWICMGAIISTSYVMQLHKDMCPPAHAPITQYSEIVAKYMRQHPELMDHEYTESIFVALSSEFPCQ
jgi:hypothetical protein